MIGARLLRTARLMAPAASACACAAVVSEYRRAESAAAPLPKVHLHYFGLQGVAETVRHVMALGEMEWTESKWAVDFKKVDMKDVANTLPIASPGFAEAQKAGVLDPNMRRAPVAIIDGKDSIGQSKTIERYLARRLGLMGADEIEEAHIDMITEHVRDIKDKYQKAKADKEEKATFFAEVMPDFMQRLEKVVAGRSVHGEGPSLVGSKLSLADVTLYVFLTDFFDDKKSASASIEGCPRLQAAMKAVGDHAGVVKYRQARDNKAT